MINLKITIIKIFYQHLYNAIYSHDCLNKIHITPNSALFSR